MSTLLEKFELDQKRRGLSPNTILLRNRQIRLYEREVGLLEDATTETIENWLDSRVKKDGNPISNKTRSCYLTTFSAFFKWAKKKKHLKNNPVEDIDRPKTHQGMPNPIPEESLALAVDRCKVPMVKCWIVIEAYAGLRCGEVSFLCREDIQHEEIRDKTDKIVSYGRIHVRHGKGGKERYVPLSPPIIEALAEYDEALGITEPPSHGRLWPAAKPANVSQRINRHYHSLGISHTAHKNRHRAGTWVHRTSGGDLLAVQSFLGHSSPSTSAIYAKVDNEIVTTAALAIPVPEVKAS